MALVELLWNLPPPDVTLAQNEVSVWCVDLDQSASRANKLFGSLSQDEQDRANQFKFDQLRCRYVVGRATLRQLLSEVMRVDPSALQFKYSSHGKPELAGGPAGRLHFNVSHSGGLALIAITKIGPVGVDLEQVRLMQNDTQIARRFFTARESTNLEMALETERPVAFFNLWTRKEAWLKATGVGIAESLNRVEMSFLPGESVRVLNVADEPGEADKWTLMELNPARGFTGALAIRALDIKVICWQFPS